ncbi:MAG: multiheme c-type cytochrome [Planctomycetia bacterium]
MILVRATLRATAAALVAAAAIACPAAEPLPAPREYCPQAAVGAAHRADDGTYAGMRPDPVVNALGAASCGTTSCHGGPKAGNHDVQSFAFTIWMNDDPHSRAYEVLHEPRSRRMARLLGLGEAHRARECLACHSMQNERREPLPPEVLADGVGCSSCHGDSTQWQQVHTLPEWKRLSIAEREALGYRDLGSVATRINNCLPCHVGDASQEVNHDLIAAGHPRLSFEFAAYQRLWPRHWTPSGKAESQPDFTERSWALGQAATLEAVAKLLEVRAERAAADVAAERPHRWPEFAEFDCYACHKALGPGSYTAYAGQFQNPYPGQPSWQPWYVAAGRLLEAAAPTATAPGTPSVGTGVVDIRRALEPDWSVADKERLDRVLLEARGLVRAARQAGQELESRDRIVLDVSHDRLDALVASAPPEWRFWDAAVQTLLVMEAAGGGPARVGTWRSTTHQPATVDTRQALEELRDSLRFPPGTDSPQGFSPVRFNRDRVAVPLPAAERP